MKCKLIRRKKPVRKKTMRTREERERYENEDMLQRGGRKRLGDRISHGYRGMLRSSKVKGEKKQE